MRVATLDYRPTITNRHMGYSEFQTGIVFGRMESSPNRNFVEWRASFGELRKTIGENILKHRRFIEFPSAVLMKSRLFAPEKRTPVASIHGIPAKSVGHNTPFARSGHIVRN